MPHSWDSIGRADVLGQISGEHVLQYFEAWQPKYVSSSAARDLQFRLAGVGLDVFKG